jgi:hypothetical protein
MIFKIYIVCCFLNLLYCLCQDDLYNEKEGYKIKDFVLLVVVLFSGPAATLTMIIVFLSELRKTLKNPIERLMNFYIIEPKKKVVRAQLGENKTQTSVTQKS